ncbi:cystathionine beta-synthase/cysteine synthase A [Amycolatopsis arida]|uniref:Cystathionine beta-synthase/cysteine synthase A n=1 Tax=Amycolatopsis arida TaxID=587909 RepID=A0A1I6A8H5_9PSEU|nr:cysteine synthase family protein [Amycolatopsis arida]TDX88515.1 cystathionine beta-synthase/cysteine synthase A [Amycolatopsis arida]SFQ65036.1 cystathionine beta-synthase/cysteine synthase A [Amycolatopsis arida]
MIHDTILDTIGRTPVVRLHHVRAASDSEILVKLESFNPGGSIKDRAAYAMVRQAERDGALRPGGTIIESTSGNLGKSLALIGATRGYRVILVIDPKAPRSMVEFVTALGAEIDMVDTPDEDGGYQRPRVNRVRHLLEVMPDAFSPDQYNNPANPRTHAEVTARELLDDVPEFDVLVTAVSTGGHASGLARTVKQVLPRVTTVGVDALGSGAFGFPFTGYAMRGLGLAWPPGNLDQSLVDRVHLVADHEGIATAHLLARHEGVLVGESSGAAVFAALHHAHHHRGRRIVVVAADGGVNYLGESFDPEWMRARGLTELIEAAGITTLYGLIEAAANPAHSAVAVSGSAADSRLVSH